MNHVFRLIMMLALTLAMTGGAYAGDSVEFRLRDGSRFRGELEQQVKVTYREQGVAIDLVGALEKVEDMYVVVRGNIAGQTKQKLIYRDDIVAIASFAAAAETDARPVGSSGRNAPRAGAAEEQKNEIPRDASGRQIHVFLLPLKGGVGDSFRHDEIVEIGKHADKFGPGQIVVLQIESNGGLVAESDKIKEAIFDIRERHRVIGWIHKAISAGCSTAMCCNELYFTSEAVAGSVTTVSGQRSLPEEMVAEHVEDLADTARRSGYSEHIARAMKLARYMVSYDKDPVTGECTFYPDMSGEHVLSDGHSNLAFNASNALDCGFSKGTADTLEDLAKLLDLPQWHETDDYGRRIAKEWQTTIERAEVEIPRLFMQWQTIAAGDQEEQLGRRINVLSQLLMWAKRAPLYTAINVGLDENQLERTLAELRKQLADMRRRNGR